MGYIIPTIDHTSSYEDFLRLMSAGKTKTGKPINLEAFMRNSAKTLRDLYEETQQRDVIVQRDPDTCRIHRISQNVTILVSNPEIFTTWLEVERAYPSGKRIKKLQEFTIRETRKRGETPEECALRGLQEELGFVPIGGEFKFWEEGGEIISTYDSTVYKDVETHVTTLRGEVISSRFSPGDLVVMKDFGGKAPANDNEGWVETTIRAFSTQ